MVTAPLWRHDLGMALPTNLHALDADALRQLLIAQDRELIWRQAKIDQLTHELSLHKRWRFGVKTERLPVEQAQLFEETVEADLAAMTGFFAQAAVRRTPVLLDGVVVTAGALAAERLAPGAKQWWQAGHRSTEPAHSLALRALELDPIVELGMRLGEGTGALVALPVLRAAVATLASMATFEEAGIDA